MNQLFADVPFLIKGECAMLLNQVYYNRKANYNLPDSLQPFYNMIVDHSNPLL